MTNVRVTYSDGSVFDNVFDDALIALSVFQAYQREIDFPCESCAVRGDLVPVKAMMTNEKGLSHA